MPAFTQSSSIYTFSISDGSQGGITLAASSVGARATVPGAGSTLSFTRGCTFPTAAAPTTTVTAGDAGVQTTLSGSSAQCAVTETYAASGTTTSYADVTTVRCLRRD